MGCYVFVKEQNLMLGFSSQQNCNIIDMLGLGKNIDNSDIEF